MNKTWLGSFFYDFANKVQFALMLTYGTFLYEDTLYICFAN
jgi:hypothetical protein